VSRDWYWLFPQRSTNE